MNKIYEAPILDLLRLKSADFLSSSGDAIGEDSYSDKYGETFA